MFADGPIHGYSGENSQILNGPRFSNAKFDFKGPKFGGPNLYRSPVWTIKFEGTTGTILWQEQKLFTSERNGSTRTAQCQWKIKYSTL